MRTFPAHLWNAVVARLRAGRPLGGPGIAISRTPAGVLIGADPAAGFEHPWKLTVRWQEEQWRMHVRPGFVNGRDVTISSVRDGAPQEVALTEADRPHLLPTWRNPLVSPGLGVSPGDDLFELPAEGYPRFFDALGVRRPGGGRTARYDPQSDAERTRELRACDVVLITPRVATNQRVDIHDPLSDAQTVTISTAFNDTYARTAPFRHRVVALPKWTPPREPTAMERLMGTAIEPQTDEIKLATVWMVSPPDTEGGEAAEPDGTWMAFPQYDVFWNLAHAPQRMMPTAPPRPITLRTGLLGGLADSIFAALLAPGNDAYNQIQALLSASTFKGRYWTA